MKSKSEQILEVISKMLDREQDINAISNQLGCIIDKLDNLEHAVAVLDPNRFKLNDNEDT